MVGGIRWISGVGGGGHFEKNKLPGRSASAFRQVGDAQIIDPNTVIHTGNAHRLPRCPASVNIKIIIQIKQSILSHRTTSTTNS